MESLDYLVKTYIHNLSVFYCIDINMDDDELNHIIKTLDKKIKEMISLVQ